MSRRPYRKTLTSEEYNAISTLTMHTKLDNSFDVYRKDDGTDCFRDFDENRYISLHQGLDLLYEGLAYPLKHEGMTDEQRKLLIDLFKEFHIGSEDGYKWLLSEDPLTYKEVVKLYDTTPLFVIFSHDNSTAMIQDNGYTLEDCKRFIERGDVIYTE